MPFENNSITQLQNPKYVQVIKDSAASYGGSQMWFPETNWYSKDYILRNYGCGTIAAADMFLYLAMQSDKLQTPITSAIQKGSDQISYEDYASYIYTINQKYTKTKRYAAVLGPLLASAINSYSTDHKLGLKATWKHGLTYYDMYDLIEEMLKQDIPVILSIGPNTPKLWGKIGIPFYEKKEIEFQSEDKASDKKPYYYQVKQNNINGHYVAVTGIVKDEITGQIMLRISSWGKLYYINYEEYRDYIENHSGTLTSSLVQVKKK